MPFTVTFINPTGLAGSVADPVVAVVAELKFNKLIKNLQKINCKGVKVVINSNTNFNDELQIDVAELADPFLLTWEHKKYMPQFLESDYTHFAYLEGNVDVSQKTFNYWLRTRKLFKDNNFNFIYLLILINFYVK